MTDIRQKVLRIITKKQLTSVMNNTRWRALKTIIDALPFAPAYQIKYVHLEEAIPHTLPTFGFGDWGPECFSHFYTIEWIKIRPQRILRRLTIHTYETEDLFDLIRTQLITYKIPFQIQQRDLIIYGYTDDTSKLISKHSMKNI